MPEKSLFEKAKCDIIEKLKTLDGNQMDVCYQICEVITSVKGKEVELLRFFYENAEMIEKSGAIEVEKVFSEDDYEIYESRYGKMINGILEATLQKGLSEEEFYRTLWNEISESSVLEDKKAKVFAVFYIWIDVRIPYFKLESGIQMEDEEFFEITLKRLKDIKKIRFIMSTKMEQKTERASLLIKVLDSIENEREKSVLMAQIMAMSGKYYRWDDEDEEE